MYEKMKIFTEYLHRQTGLNIEYIPAINYSHAYELFASGKVDLFWSSQRASGSSQNRLVTVDVYVPGWG